MENENKTLIDRLLDAGYPFEELYNHCADLYIFKNDLTDKVVSEWMADNGFKPNKFMIDTFTDIKTGKQMYDIAFQYLPWWEQKIFLAVKEVQ